jgi:hypothetical protein
MWKKACKGWGGGPQRDSVKKKLEESVDHGYIEEIKTKGKREGHGVEGT